MNKLMSTVFWLISLGLQFLLVSTIPSGYLLWGTRFLYHKHNFVVDPKNIATNAPKFQNFHGYRGDHYIANLNQSVVETNKKLFDVEDSTRSYKSPLSHW